jgi:hypothetical protein
MSHRLVGETELREEARGREPRGHPRSVSIQPECEHERFAVAIESVFRAVEPFEELTRAKQRVEPAAVVVLAEQRERLLVIPELPLRDVMATHACRRFEICPRRPIGDAGLLALFGEHFQILLVRADLRFAIEPVGQEPVPFSRVGGARQSGDALALLAVTEDVFFVARKRRVGEPHHVIALRQALQTIGDVETALVVFFVPEGGRDAIGAIEDHEAAEPKHAAHQRRALQKKTIRRPELVDARLQCRLGARGRRRKRPAIAVIPRRFFDAAGIAAGDFASLLDDVHRRETAGAEERADERRGVDFAERFEMKHGVARRLRPHFRTRQELRSRGTDEHYRPAQVLDEEVQHVDRLLVREVQIVEHEAKRALRDVDFEQAFQNGALRHRRIDRRITERLGDRAIGKFEADQPTEHVKNVADLAIVEERRDLGAHAELRLFRTERIDHVEPLHQELREAAPRRIVIRRARAKHPRRALLAGMNRSAHELVDETCLADARGAHHRYTATFPRRANLLRDGFERIERGCTSEERRRGIREREPRTESDLDAPRQRLQFWAHGFACLAQARAPSSRPATYLEKHRRNATISVSSRLTLCAVISHRRGAPRAAFRGACELH